MKTWCFKQLRTFLPAIVLAVLGFSYALTTSVEGSGSRALDSREVIGTACTRIPTQFVTATNLGVVVAGSQFTRQIVVQFGFKPHLFSIGRVKPAGAITISESGTISGKVIAEGTDIFEIIVADKTGEDILPATTKIFTITAVKSQQEPNLPEQIINSSTMPDAVANEPYSFTFHANGGFPPYEFLIIDGPQGPLPKGLALNTSTGLLFGKPTVATPTGQPFKFTLGLVDSTRLVVFKDFFLNVRPGTISSDLVATKGTMRLNFGKDGSTDSLTLTIVFNKVDLSNAGIRTVADLEGQSFAMDFGGIQLPARVSATTTGTQTASTFNSKFDKSGSIRFPNLLSAAGGVTTTIPKKTDPRYEINLNPRTGIMKLKFTNVDLIRGIGARFASFNDPVVPISVKIGAPAQDALNSAAQPEGGTTTTPADTNTVRSGINFDRTDSIKFIYRRSGSKGRATAARNDKIPAGGLFLVTKIQGKALRESTVNDRLVLNLTGFMRLPGGAPIAPSATDRVQVLLGEKCLGDFPASSLVERGEIVRFENTDQRAGLKSLVIDNKKGTFTLETFDFNTTELFGQNVLEAGVPFSVPMTLTIANVNTAGFPVGTPTFDGQTSVTVFRKGNTIVNK